MHETMSVVGEDATIDWTCETDGSLSANDLEVRSCRWNQVRSCGSSIGNLLPRHHLGRIAYSPSSVVAVRSVGTRTH